jgi:hypothetical protein
MTDDEDWKRYLQMAASGGLTGAAMGGIGRILSGSRSLPAILASAAGGGALGASTIPGAAYLGEQVMGAPTTKDLQPYTARAGLGGASVGGLLGAGAGAATGSGLASRLAEALPGAAKTAGANLPLDNIIVDKLKRAGGWKGALAGGLLGAGTLGYMAADEGQQMDTIRNIMRSKNELPN